MWMSNPLWQTFLQFRNYTFTAYENQLQYALHMRDMNAFAALAWGIAWNATVRALQVQALAWGRSDRDKYLEKNLDPWELGKAGFQRSGMSSILPMVADTAGMLAGQGAMFNARATAQPTDIWMGSPAVSMLNQAVKGGGGAVRSGTQGTAMSQGEARALFGLLPGSNLPPVTSTFSYLINDLPERSRSEEKHQEEPNVRYDNHVHGERKSNRLHVPLQLSPKVPH